LNIFFSVAALLIRLTPIAMMVESLKLNSIMHV